MKTDAVEPVPEGSPVTREEHFRLLNEWQHTPEWKADYSFNFYSLVGKRWEITEELFWEFLEVLPPVRWKARPESESFYISEALSGNIRSKYIREGRRYFHEWAILPDTPYTKEWDVLP